MMGLMGLIAVMLLAACSPEEAQVVEPAAEPQEAEYVLPIAVSVSASAFRESKNGRGTSRAWTPPDGYYLYDDAMLYGGSPSVLFRNFSSLASKDIDAFFTLSNEASPLRAHLKYNKEKKQWNFTLFKVAPDEIASGTYYVYGYIPREAAANLTVVPTPTYSSGTVLTLQEMKTVGYDACVVIGAKNGYDRDHDGNVAQTERLRAGEFAFDIQTGKDASEQPYDNFLFLLFDHLCAAVQFRMRIDEEYDRLRTVKVKELHLQTGSDTEPSKRTNVSVTLIANTTGANPIADVTYTPTTTTDTGNNIFTSKDGVTLTTNYSDNCFLTHVMPQDVSTLVLTWTYDIYDKKGNLVRKDSRATNTIQLRKVLSGSAILERGTRYTINLTVKPTYLYVMSDPDLENPTVEY